MDIELVGSKEATQEDIDEVKAEFHPSNTSNVMIESCPRGGGTNQVLKKNSDDDYDVSWVNQNTLIDTQHVYSTAEKKIGKWIDGKDLYERVYSGTFTATTGSWVSFITITDATKIIIRYFEVSPSDSTLTSICLNYGTSIKFGIKDNIIKVHNSDANLKSKPYILIAQYTK